LTQIAEYTVKRLALITLVFLFVLSVATPYLPTAKAQTTYNYYLMGPLNEVTADWLPGNMTITAHLWAGGVGSEPTVSVNSSATYNLTTSYPVRYFAFDYNETGVNQHREYWFDTSDLVNATYRGWFSPDTLNTYTISFLDYTGKLQDYPYILTKAYVLGTASTIEKRVVDAQGTILNNLVSGTKYQIVYSNGTTSTIYGDIVPATSAGIQLVLRGVDFASEAAKKQLLLYQYVHAYAQRDFLNPIGAITVSYEDLTSKTNSVLVTITNNGTTVFSQTFTAQTFSYTWASAVNSTSYEVTVAVNHQTFGLFDFKQYLLGEYTKASDPFSLSFLGSSMGISTAMLLPALLIIFVAGCFSELTSEVAAILTVIIAIVLTALGWIDIGQGAIISALALAVMSGIIAAKRRMNVY
jgi:hypothetical protein